MKKSTRCVAIDSQTGQPGAVQPIDPSTAFEYIDSGAQPYPRYFNTPNQDAVARKLAALENAEAALVFASGMAAISTTMVTVLKSGDHAVFLKGLYGGSHVFVTGELEDRGITFSFAEKEFESIKAAVQPNTRLIYVESPTNPMLEIVDLRAIAKFAESLNEKGQRVTTVIDNTFASPINQNPIDLGFDIVIHSGTKYLGGHSDLCCGAIMASQKRIDEIRIKAKRYGGNLNAISCYLLDRSLKTLDVRVQKQNENAAALAEFLSDHDQVKSVWYPGLNNHPGHEIAKGQMHHPGAMIAFELDDAFPVVEFLKNLNIIRPALSLGGVESSVCVPATTSHRDVPPSELAASGITPQVIRLSVGIEAIDDLKSDFEKAISNSQSSAKQIVGSH